MVTVVLGSLKEARKGFIVVVTVGENDERFRKIVFDHVDKIHASL